MRIYLAGYIHGNKIQECSEWRKKIVQHYRNWKGNEEYPITWLDPLNGKMLETISDNGLKSNIPAKAILRGDIMSVESCDLLIANMNKFGESRDLTGTTCEVAIAGYLNKPIIIITKDDNYRNHPFINSFATIIVETAEELLEKKYINYFFKRINNAQYK